MMQFLSRFARARWSNLAAHASAVTLGSLFMLPESHNANATPPEVGVWVDHDGKGAIEIKPCGPALCGNIVWLKNPLNDEGQPLYDRRNPTEARRNRPICGLPVIGNLRMMSEGWDEGWIYSPEEGSQYDLAIQASGPNKLIVTGYKGVKLFSKTFTWTRAPASLVKCDGSSQSKAPGTSPVKAASPKPGPAAPATGTKPPVAKATTGPPSAGTKKVAAPEAKPVAKSPDAKAKAHPPVAATSSGAKKPAGTAAATPKPTAAKTTASTNGVPTPKPAARPPTAQQNAAQPPQKKAVVKTKTADEETSPAIE